MLNFRGFTLLIIFPMSYENILFYLFLVKTRLFFHSGSLSVVGRTYFLLCIYLYKNIFAFNKFFSVLLNG